MEELKSESLSEKFKNTVYEQYFNSGGDADHGIALADNFLEENPDFPEALLFKARMLMVGERYDDALSYLEKVKEVDEWRLSYGYDMAEIYYKKGKKEKAVKSLEISTQGLLDEIVGGIDNFLLGIDAEPHEKMMDLITKRIIAYISKKANRFEIKDIL